MMWRWIAARIARWSAGRRYRDMKPAAEVYQTYKENYAMRRDLERQRRKRANQAKGAGNGGEMPAEAPDPAETLESFDKRVIQS